MFKKLIPLVVGSLLVLALGWPAARPAMAAPPTPDISYTVDSLLDEVDDNVFNSTCHTASNSCTLRAAIMQANHLPATYTNVTINLPAGTYRLTLIPLGANDATSGDLNLTCGGPFISLVGAGAASTIIDAHLNDRVMTVELGCKAYISDLTLTGGSTYSSNGGGGLYNAGIATVVNSIIRDNSAASSVGAPGGGIRNAGYLSMDHSAVIHNYAVLGGGLYNTASLRVENSSFSINSAIAGGAIASSGPLTVINSTLSGNDAVSAGAIYNVQNSLTVDRSTLSGNSATADGGGIYNEPAAFLTLINSTVSGNQAAKSGGGLHNLGAANLYNSTIAANRADAGNTAAGTGGGVYDSGTTNLRNTLLAGNTVGNAPAYDDCTGTLNTYGQNVLGAVEGPVLCTVNPVTGGWTALNSLGLLGPLQNNGGPTLTHALLPGSNAIDWGDPAQGCIGPDSNLLPTDQRGLPRTVGVACDIGAFEFLPPVAYLPFLGR